MEETPVPLRVSVLIVCFNSAPALRRCLAALEAAAERPSFEIIVVDNGSRDDTPQVEHEFPSVTFLKLPRNFGFTKALNIGMRTAKAELFLFLDPRVEVRPGTVGALAAKLDAETAAVAVAPWVEPEPKLYRLPRREDLARVMRADAFDAAAPDGEIEFAPFTALMVRGYFLKGLRYIDERYAQTWGDAEVAMQIRRAGRKTLLASEVKCTLHPDPDPFDAAPKAVRKLLEVDWVTGAATFATKHYGFWPGWSLRIGAALRALAGLKLSLVSGALGGKKIDGTQPIP
jgi:GT2 family glycosyltransferase